MKNYDNVFIWLGLICVVNAGIVAHDVSKWAFLLTLGLYVPLCVFATEKHENRTIGFFVASLATLVVMLLLMFNAHFAFMLIPSSMLVAYALISDRDCLSSVAVWISALLWGAMLFAVNNLMYLLV